MTKRAGPYRHIKPLPGPPLTHHEEWVCIGCGTVEWLANGHRLQRHCAKGCWTLVANLTEIGGAYALYALIKCARAEHGLETVGVELGSEWDAE